MAKFKIEVGQTWKPNQHKYDGRYFVTRVDLAARSSYAIMNHENELPFVIIDENGISEYDMSGWQLLPPTDSKFKIQVGQQWTLYKEKYIFTISKVMNGKCFYQENDMEKIFIFLDPFGFPYDHHMIPHMELVSSDNKEIKSETYKLMSFFSAVPDGYCKCNCLKELCFIHKNI